MGTACFGLLPPPALPRMLDNDVKKVASFDGGFDRIEGIERLSLD